MWHFAGTIRAGLAWLTALMTLAAGLPSSVCLCPGSRAAPVPFRLVARAFAGSGGPVVAHRSCCLGSHSEKVRQAEVACCCRDTAGPSSGTPGASEARCRTGAADFAPPAFAEEKPLSEGDTFSWAVLATDSIATAPGPTGFRSRLLGRFATSASLDDLLTRLGRLLI
jgi:hypothetical protein